MMVYHDEVQNIATRTRERTSKTALQLASPGRENSIDEILKPKKHSTRQASRAKPLKDNNTHIVLADITNAYLNSTSAHGNGFVIDVYSDLVPESSTDTVRIETSEVQLKPKKNVNNVNEVVDAGPKKQVVVKSGIKKQRIAADSSNILVDAGVPGTIRKFGAAGTTTIESSRLVISATSKNAGQKIPKTNPKEVFHLLNNKLEILAKNTLETKGTGKVVVGGKKRSGILSMR